MLTDDWNRPCFTKTDRAIAYSIWLLCLLCFAVGLANRDPHDDIWPEIIVILCIIVTLSFALINYHTKRTFRHFAMILVIAVWAIGFALERLGIIGVGVYAVVIAAFIGSLVFVRSRP